jgi:hypothetical protein
MQIIIIFQFCVVLKLGVSKIEPKRPNTFSKIEPKRRDGGPASPAREVADRFYDLESLAANNYRKYGQVEESTKIWANL